MKARSLLPVFALLLVVACGEEAPPPEEVVRPVKILELGSEEAGGVLEFPGTVKAAESADLAFEVPGKLVERPVTEGQEVEAGTLLARLDPRDYEMELAAQKALADSARVEMERKRKLFEANVAPRQELDVKMRNYDVAVARAEQAAKAVDDTRLLAPFTGTVARIAVENFENVQAKQLIMRLENDASFDVDVSIPEQDAARLTPGLSLEERTLRGEPRVEISALPGRSFPAMLTEFATSADPDTRTFSARFRFENPRDVTIHSGMTAKILVTVRPELGIVASTSVPLVATVADESGNPFVWVVDPDTLKVARRSVVLGEIDGASVPVLEGLEGTEWIAISGVHHLREGMVVRRLGQ